MTESIRRRTNPARRLHSFLTKAKQEKPNIQTGQALANVLSLPRADAAELYRKVAGVLELIDEVSNQLEALPAERREIYKTFVPKIRECFPQNFALTRALNDHFGKLAATDLALLFLAASELDSLSDELEVFEDELASIAKDTNSLFEKVSESELEPALKVIVLDLLEAIRRTVADYQIRGAKGLERMLAESLGRFAIDKDLVDRESKSEEIVGFWELLRRITMVICAVNQTPQLVEHITQLVALLKR